MIEVRTKAMSKGFAFSVTDEYVIVSSNGEDFHKIPLELVDEQRKDVDNIEQLIRNRLEKQEKRVEKYDAFNKLNLNDAKARKQELEQVLQEIQRMKKINHITED